MTRLISYQCKRRIISTRNIITFCVINCNIRKWSYIPKQNKIFNSYIDNSELLAPYPTSVWKLVLLTGLLHPFDLPTSERLSRRIRSHIKNNFIYPAADILQSNYQSLYPTSPINCLDCKHINFHVTFCSQHWNDILYTL